VSGGTQLWLLLLVALAVLFVLTLRRMSALAARTHSLDQFQRAARQLDRRFAEAADPLVAQLDELRRRAGDPRAVSNGLPAVTDALRAVRAEARALRAPALLADRAAALARELERAVRAAELVEHGLDAMLAGRGYRELEAQVSLKRGALNLRHARGAVTQLVVEIASVDPADLAQPSARRSTRHLPSVPTYIVEGSDPDDDEPFDPRI
jgi:hypothetical protein